MELSTTSNTRWCSPRSAVSPMYMPGRLRTASRPSRTLMFSAPYPGAEASPLVIAIGALVERAIIPSGSAGCHLLGSALVGSETHRHEHVSEGGILRSLEHARPDLVGHPQLDHVAGGMHAEHVEEVARIEADRHRLPAIGHFDVLAGLPLLGVACRDLEGALLQA